MHGKRKLLVLCLVAGAVVLCFLWLVLFARGRHALRSWMSSMDIMAGRVHYEEFILGAKVRDRAGETDLSSMYCKYTGEPPPPVWGAMYWVDSVVIRRLRIIPRIQCDGPYVGPATGGRWMAGQLGVEGLFAEDAKRAALVKFFTFLRQDRPGRADGYATVA